MKAQGLFVVGFTAEEVLAIQGRAKELILEGKTLMTWGEGGSSAGKQFAMAVADVLAECAYALPILDPETYPPRRSVGMSRIVAIQK